MLPTNFVHRINEQRQGEKLGQAAGFVHDYVKTVKQSAEVRNRYMTTSEMLDASKAEGRLEGAIDMCIQFVKKE